MSNVELLEASPLYARFQLHGSLKIERFPQKVSHCRRVIKPEKHFPEAVFLSLDSNNDTMSLDSSVEQGADSDISEFDRRIDPSKREHITV